MARKGLRALTKQEAWRAKNMYEEKDDRGRRRWTMLDIASTFGVGETTIWRAIREVGPFAEIAHVVSEDEVDRRGREQLERVMRGEVKSTGGFIPEAKHQDLSTPMLRKAALFTGNIDEETYARLEAEAAVAAVPSEERKVVDEGPPPSPLDGGDSPDETGGTGVNMLVNVANAQPAPLLNELIEGEKNGAE